jgi:hypothetical protein
MGKRKNAVRADGLYRKDIDIGRDDNGKRIRQTIYAHSQKELDEKTTEFKASIGKGLDVSRHETFTYWAKLWISSQRNNVSANWLKSQKHMIEQLNLTIGFMEITKIRVSDVQRVIDDLAEKNPFTGRPSSKHTLSVYKSVADGVMKMAVMNRVIDYNPVDAIRIPSKAPQKTRRALTDEERRWIEETPHRAQTAAMIMLLPDFGAASSSRLCGPI